MNSGFLYASLDVLRVCPNGPRPVVSVNEIGRRSRGDTTTSRTTWRQRNFDRNEKKKTKTNGLPQSQPRTPPRLSLGFFPTTSYADIELNRNAVHACSLSVRSGVCVPPFDTFARSVFHLISRRASPANRFGLKSIDHRRPPAGPNARKYSL